MATEEREGGNGHDNRREVTIHFEVAPEYKVIAANGVWGGITPRGDFKLDFFIESAAIPEALTHELTPAGLGKIVRRNTDRQFVRRIEVGIMISIQHAESIADFIRKQIADRRAKEEKKEDR